MNCDLLPSFITVCGITVCATFELLDIKFCVVGNLSYDDGLTIGDCWMEPDDGNITWFDCCDGNALAAIAIFFGELADENTGNGFIYCVTGGWSPLIWRKIWALWWAIWAICALFVASKLPILISCGVAEAGIATGCHGAYLLLLSQRERNEIK